MAENFSENRKPNQSFRTKLEELGVKAVRFYTFNTPIARGKYRLYQAALKMCQNPPTALETETKDGRKFVVNLTTEMHEMIYFIGEYEKVLTDTVGKLLREGDVCLDVGANFGWYSTVFRQKCGASGAVHAFEPIPATFRELRRSRELMGSPENVYLNNIALGDHHERITLNLFGGLGSGRASISAQGRGDATQVECEMITLDSYLEKENIGDVNFVKVDVEGAELMFLKGAENLFKQKIPPMWLIEMSLITSRDCGYLPGDLIDFLRARADYDFYAVDEYIGTLQKIENFAPDDLGANVICLPRGHYQDRIAALESKMI